MTNVEERMAMGEPNRTQKYRRKERGPLGKVSAFEAWLIRDAFAGGPSLSQPSKSLYVHVLNLHFDDFVVACEESVQDLRIELGSASFLHNGAAFLARKWRLVGLA